MNTKVFTRNGKIVVEHTDIEHDNASVTYIITIDRDQSVLIASAIMNYEDITDEH